MSPQRVGTYSLRLLFYATRNIDAYILTCFALFDDEPIVEETGQ